MADITRLGFLRHYRGTPTDHVIHVRAGRTSHTGAGQAFWFRALTAALAEVPLDDKELPLLLHARTRDFQDVTVQATVGYRFADPDAATGHLDFAINADTGQWRAAPLDRVAQLLTELAQQHAADLLTDTTMAAAVSRGLTAVRDRVTDGLTDDPRLAGTGITVTGVRVLAIRPEPELERALQTPTREQLQQDADKAVFERRALAVERERAISENELQSQIELATREEQLVAQHGANERRRVTEAAAAARIQAEAAADADRIDTAARADGIRQVGDAEAAAEAARMAALDGTDPTILLALALRELAADLPQIGTLTITPDLLTAALAQLTGTGSRT